MIDAQTALPRAAATGDNQENATNEMAVQQALVTLKAHSATPQTSHAAELRYRLTMLIFPSILLVFVALYVTSLGAAIEPEVSLFRAGGAAVILAVLARVAVGILGDESHPVLDDRQIMAMARGGAMRAYLSGPDGPPVEGSAGRPSAGTEQPTSAAQAAGTGGKE